MRTYLDMIQKCLHFLDVQEADQGWCATPFNHILPEPFGKKGKGEQTKNVKGLLHPFHANVRP